MLKIWFCVIAILLEGFLSGNCTAEDMKTAYAAAALDVKRLPKREAIYCRYFYRPPELGDAKENAKKLAEAGRFDSCWRNFLSREPEMGQAARITPYLWRVNIEDYRWTPEIWENLLEVEPWFHVRVLSGKVKEKSGEPVAEEKPANKISELLKHFPRRRVLYQATGKYGYQVYMGDRWISEEDAAKELAEALKEERAKQGKPEEKPFQKPTTLVATADWVDAADAAVLIAATQSQVPVVRADWFLNQTGQAQKRVVGYFDWLGLGKTLKDFDKLVGAHIDESRELRKSHRAVIGKSSVAFNNRGMEGGATLTEGIRFLTEDYKASTNEKHPLRLLQGDAKKDGGEALGNLPNGLIAMFVVNADDQRLDAVPPDIASDRTSHNADMQVHAGSCMRCHKEGYRPINDWARRIYTAPFKLDSPDYKLQRELRSAYLSRLEKFLDRGRATYKDALEKFSYTPVTFSKAWEENWSAYTDAEVDLGQLSRWTGIKPEVLNKAFLAEAERREAVGSKLDPVLAGLVQGIPARIEWIEEMIPEIMRIGHIP